MDEEVTLDEAAQLLKIPVGTLWSWRGRQLIWPASRVFNPATNRQVNVYKMKELEAVKQRLSPRHGTGS